MMGLRFILKISDTGQSLYNAIFRIIELDRVISEPHYKGIFYIEIVGKWPLGSQDLAVL